MTPKLTKRQREVLEYLDFVDRPQAVFPFFSESDYLRRNHRVLYGMLGWPEPTVDFNYRNRRHVGWHLTEAGRKALEAGR